MKLIPYRDILLVKKSRSFWAYVVKICLKQEYIHSEYVISDWLTMGTDLKRPVSISAFGYNISDIDIYRLKVPPTEKQTEIIIEELQKATKMKYDRWEAVCVGLGLPIRDNSRYICISLITEALEKAGCLCQGCHRRFKGFDIFTSSGYFERL